MRYYGWYSTRMRGDHQRAALSQEETENNAAENTEENVISNFRMKIIPHLVYRESIKKDWEVDPLLCLYCGGLMKIVGFIYERKVIILKKFDSSWSAQGSGDKA